MNITADRVRAAAAIAGVLISLAFAGHAVTKANDATKRADLALSQADAALLKPAAAVPVNCNCGCLSKDPLKVRLDGLKLPTP